MLSLPITVFSADDDEESAGGIEEVIVTAERRAASIQDTATFNHRHLIASLIDSLNLRNQEDLAKLYSCNYYSTI